ncbi:hypothetical protein LCGC14_2183410 [marine sediment metagenome]|uniref:Uncharacterized protein n=1 Tax=marine sediment metagenome TaxID=412755 RepID=A0A0F9DLQ0_9ZZZZ
MQQRIIAQFTDKCGCSVTGTDDKGSSFDRCKLHADAPAMHTGHEHIILHAEDRCDCGRSYGNIAHGAIKEAK